MLIKMYVHDIYSRFRVGAILSIKNMNMVFLDNYLHCFKIYHFRPWCFVSYFLFSVLGMKWNSYVSIPDFCDFIYYNAIMRH